MMAVPGATTSGLTCRSAGPRPEKAASAFGSPPTDWLARAD